MSDKGVQKKVMKDQKWTEERGHGEHVSCSVWPEDQLGENRRGLEGLEVSPGISGVWAGMQEGWMAG
jgi:hypothetical protein